MKVYNCKNLVIGGTFFGVGYACANNETIIIEKTSRLGSEFVDSFISDFENEDKIETACGKELLDEFYNRNIVSKTHSPIITAYPSVLSNIVIKNNIKVLFKTVIVNVTYNKNYEVIISNSNGLSKIICDKVVNTQNDNFYKKTLNCIVTGKNKIQGFNDDFSYVKIDVEVNDDMRKARKKAFGIFNKSEKNKLVQTAYDFEYYFKGDEPLSYKNPVIAFEKGYNFKTDTVFEFNNEEANLEYDVVVCGLGTSGAVSMLTLTQNNISVLGLECEGTIGGIPTTGQVLGYYYGAKGGSFERIDEEAYNNECFAKANKRFFDHLLPDSKVEVLENSTENADIRYRAFVYEVIKEKNKVTGLKFVCQNKKFAVKCKFVIDTTGEADICALAGVETDRGRKTDNKVQPFSICTMTVKDGYANSFYCDNGYINPNDNEEYSKIALKTYLSDMFLKEKYDENNYFTVISPVFGTREGRRIISKVVYTFEDYLNGKSVESPLFYAHSNLDTHSREHAFESDNFIEWAIVSRLRKMNFSVPVCIDNLLPKNIEGIIVGGKSLGVDHDISPCVRMKRDMQKLGEACAEIVTLAIKENTELENVSYEKLKVRLKDSGCLNDENNFQDFCIGKEYDGTKICVDGNWYTDISKIKENMKDEKLSSIAIMSAVKLKIKKELLSWIDIERENVSLALGIMGEDEALEYIRERVNEHPLMDKSEERDDLLSDLAVIYLAGKFADEKCLENIINIFKISLNNTKRNQYLFFSINALKKYYLSEKVSNNDYLQLTEMVKDVKICLNKSYNIYSDITEQIKNYMKEVV